MLSEEKDLMNNMQMELRRGILVLSVLSQMGSPKYGYALVQRLDDRGINIDPDTLYPLLRRLEKQGLLESNWEMGGSKPRKYYKRTDYGLQVYVELKNQWKQMVTRIEKLIVEDDL